MRGKDIAGAQSGLGWPIQPRLVKSMTIKFHHIHLKARDPEKTAAWYGRAFGFTIAEKVLRPAGDMFITCKSTDGTIIAISGQKTGEALPQGSSATHLGLEHFAVETQEFDADLARLTGLGAKLLDQPVTTPAGIRFAFIEAPDDVRIELMYFPKR
jgi:catechol 2,3-dioxygenase-like lactoylglutathione lyase family enzyme